MAGVMRGDGALDDASDRLLVERSRDGDTVAFAALIRRHGPFLRAYAQRLVGSPSDADDVAQEAMILAWRRLDSLDDGSRFRSWALSILSRKVTDLYRSRKETLELDERFDSPAREPGPEALGELSAELSELSRVLRGLPLEQRQCWMLREVSGFSYAEIAAQLELDVSTVRGMLARARVTVMKEMGGWR